MNERYVFIMVATLALVIGMGVRFWKGEFADTTQMPLPAFEFADLAGVTQNVSQWQGKALVINFWATWCLPCLQEIPDFMVLQERLGTQRVQFIGVALDDREAVEAFQQKKQVNYPLLIAGDWQGFHLAKSLGNTMGAIPYTVVVNPAGQVIFHHAGQLSVNALEKILLP
jgi:peroxiredoxin